MATAVSRIFSPTALLYLFVVTDAIAQGIYAGVQADAPGAFVALSWVALLWIVGWWLRVDSRKRGVAWVHDMGLFLMVAWPFIMPYYLIKSRGARGLLNILGFVGVYLGAAIIGILISMSIAGIG
jgi:hypothetical protein